MSYREPGCDPPDLESYWSALRPAPPPDLAETALERILAAPWGETVELPLESFLALRRGHTALVDPIVDGRPLAMNVMGRIVMPESSAEGLRRSISPEDIEPS